ncbi:segregation and condensation protein A [Roseicitreum antarcticum]|uniref:Segregation and condensation protein A n=1 Tax=Roseicitreum antarcticum TaxID=564137 RepID=A0A1H3A3C8_9RHOB|nr:ScpA family protein [Roseicitreum antarcticum]SDX24125.1 condensin subunit ScpA [Roseicitreum antarcticum]
MADAAPPDADPPELDPPERDPPERDPWEDSESPAARLAAEALIIDVDGFEGPLDLLLTLSRSQKVDLRRVSVLQLAEQYLSFIARARALRLELAADYLVMAAWLAFLKSRLLLPPDPADEGPSGAELAAHLAFQLERLGAMRDAAARLMGRDQKGRDFFVRGQPQSIALTRKTNIDASLLDLMKAYARLRTRDEFRPYAFDRSDIYPLEAALERLRDLIGQHADWTDLSRYLPEGWRGAGPRKRSAMASTFAASLELAKQGQVELRQSDTFAPLHLRPKAAR